jgi:hypothetical protein
MFCMRMARDAFPNDPSGSRFVPLCEGTSTDVPSDVTASEKGKGFAALIERRADTVAALDQSLGEEAVTDSRPFGDDELKGFLTLLLPLYEGDRIVPRSTEALAKVMTRLTDANDANSVQVLETIARISKRTGYRSPDRVLAAIRPALTYERLDELTSALLGLVAKGGNGHDAFMQVLEASALELAEPAEPKQNPSVLELALQLVLTPDQLYVDAEPGALEALPVLKRDDNGDAIPVGGDTPTPFLVAGREDDTDRVSGTTLALSSGQPAYETFDANQTALASLMRDSVSLIQRGDKPRSTIEMLLRSARPLLGKDKTRTEAFGDKTLSFQGPDIENGPLGNFVHSLTTLLKLPETKPLLQVLDQLLATNEAAATELIYAALKIRDESKKADYDNAKLGNGQPHEFWDDLIKFGQDIITNRPGLLQDILLATLDPLTASQGPILAHQMTFKDEVKLSSETDVNSEVTTGCPKGDAAMSLPAYCVPVDRAAGDVGMNRSLFQRTLSLIHATYAAGNCNKEGATLTVQQPVSTTFPNPPLGPLAPIIGALGGGTGACPTSTVAPPPATSYPRCSVIQQKSGAVTQMRAILGRAEIKIKDPEITECAKAVGTTIDESQERESGIKGFTTKPTAKAIARYVYAPRTKFLTDLFEPLPTIHGVSINALEPNGIYPLEVVDPDAKVGDTAQSFLTAIVPLLSAFDNKETFDANGDHNDKYYFAELFDLIHMHYSSPRTELCPDQVAAGNEGCTQSVDPKAKFYSKGTNLVSYEPLLAWSLTEQNLLGVLQRSTQAFKDVTVDGRDGVQILDAFLKALLLPNPDVKYRNGQTYAKTNLCVVSDGADGNPTCQAGPDGEPLGRVIQGGVPPLYLMLDALKDVDAMWSQNAESHDLYLQVRSTLVDKLLDVSKAADGKTALSNRRAYALTRKAVPWLLARLAEHPDQPDLADWADGLVGRLAGVLAHPLAARGMDLFDQFWDNREAGDEVAKLLAYLFDDKGNPEAFTGAIVALSDTLTFFNKDPDLTPAIRFAALALAEDAIDVVEGSADAPNVEEGTAYRLLETTRAISDLDKGEELSTLAKLLRNTVLPMANTERPLLNGKSPLEVYIDVIAEVNRVDPEQPSDVTLSAEDDKQVFEKLNDFLSSDQVGLQRLYKVIENREIK